MTNYRFDDMEHTFDLPEDMTGLRTGILLKAQHPIIFDPDDASCVFDLQTGFLTPIGLRSMEPTELIYLEDGTLIERWVGEPSVMGFAFGHRIRKLYGIDEVTYLSGGTIRFRDNTFIHLYGVTYYCVETESVADWLNIADMGNTRKLTVDELRDTPRHRWKNLFSSLKLEKHTLESDFKVNMRQTKELPRIAHYADDCPTRLKFLRPDCFYSRLHVYNVEGEYLRVACNLATKSVVLLDLASVYISTKGAHGVVGFDTDALVFRIYEQSDAAPTETLFCDGAVFSVTSKHLCLTSDRICKPFRETCLGAIGRYDHDTKHYICADGKQAIIDANGVTISDKDNSSIRLVSVDDRVYIDAESLQVYTDLSCLEFVPAASSFSYYENHELDILNAIGLEILDTDALSLLEYMYC